MLLKIKSVDMNGYLGRDYHPKPSDVGLVVRPIKMESVFFDEVMGDEYHAAELLDDDLYGVMTAAVRAEISGEQAPEGHLYDVWTCMREDGTRIELISHEVEEVKL